MFLFQLCSFKIFPYIHACIEYIVQKKLIPYHFTLQKCVIKDIINLSQLGSH